MHHRCFLSLTSESRFRLDSSFLKSSWLTVGLCPLTTLGFFGEDEVSLLETLLLSVFVASSSSEVGATVAKDRIDDILRSESFRRVIFDPTNSFDGGRGWIQSTEIAVALAVALDCDEDALAAATARIRSAFFHKVVRGESSIVLVIIVRKLCFENQQTVAIAQVSDEHFSVELFTVSYCTWRLIVLQLIGFYDSVLLVGQVLSICSCPHGECRLSEKAGGRRGDALSS